MRPSLHIAAVLLVASALAPASLAAQEAQVDALFARLNAEPSPGVAVAVVRDGRLAFAKGYGLGSLEHRVPITPQTVFDIASVSKQFAAFAIALLVQEGKVDLDADISRYVPEMRPLTSRQPITVRHLVHHVSGLRDWPATLAVAGWRMDDVISYDQILRFAYAQRSLNFTPGSEYTYSNTGYNLLAEVVARVSGMPFPRFARERIFAPLGMAQSHFQDDHTAIVPGRASGYAMQPDRSFRVMTDNLTALGSSSLFSTVEDLAKWAVNLETGAVGGPAVQALMRSRFRLTRGDTIAYAFGLSHGTHRGLPTLAHSGSWAQFTTFLLHLPGQRLTVIVLANSAIVNAGQSAYDVADAFLGPRVTAAAPDTSLRARAAVAVPARTLDAYAGLYRLGPGWYLQIRRDGEILRTRATNEGEFPMVAKSEREFWIDAYNGGLVFRPAASGRVDTLVYRGIRAPRVDTTTARRALTAAELAAIAGTYESEELGTRYTIGVANGMATLTHWKHGTVPLAWTWQEFTTPWWFVRGVGVERDAGGRVTGIVLDAGERSRRIRFARR